MREIPPHVELASLLMRFRESAGALDYVHLDGPGAALAPQTQMATALTGIAI
jgi:hypothetical protein